MSVSLDHERPAQGQPTGPELLELAAGLIEALRAGHDELDVPTRVLAAIFDPIAAPPWQGIHLAAGPAGFRSMVMSAVRLETYCRQPWDSLAVEGMPVAPRRHANRIAWLVRHGWPDPITVDARAHARRRHPLPDGNHRLYAAMIRDDAMVRTRFEGPEPLVTAMIVKAVRTIEAEPVPVPPDHVDTAPAP